MHKSGAFFRQYLEVREKLEQAEVVNSGARKGYQRIGSKAHRVTSLKSRSRKMRPLQSSEKENQVRLTGSMIAF